MVNPEAYVQHLLSELCNSEWMTGSYCIDTVYIGGGTPTALPSFLLCKILDAVKALPLLPDAEITVEANPGTLSLEYLRDLNVHGANRLSLGLQTTHTHLLSAIGRGRAIHSDLEIFIQNYHQAKAAGFDNINIDLMFALPSQTLQEWQETLQEVVALSPQHISAYSLTPAENTPLFDALEKGELILPDDETDRNMYHYAREFLADAGYMQYELSNFAKPGFESRHNVNCWKRVPYIGFGLGAHSFDGTNRWHNTEEMKEYIISPQKKGFQSLTESEAFAEKIILGLRLTDGILESEIPDQYAAKVQTLITDGLLKHENQNICLTPRGMDLANVVFTEFL